MAKYDESYEQAITKLLSDSLEQGVPEDMDVWPKVQQRLMQRAAPGPDPVRSRYERVWRGPVSLLSRLSTPTVPRKTRSFLSSMAMVMIFFLLAAVTITAISRLAQQKVVNVGLPPPLSDTLFTMPVDRANIHWHAGTWPGISGFEAAPDGSFYLSDADRRLLHYSSKGALLDVRSYTNSSVPLFLTMQGSYLWVYTSMGDATNSGRKDTGFNKVADDGKDVAGYTWQSSSDDPFQGAPNIVSGTQSIPINSGLTSLRIGGDGQFMVEDTPLNAQGVPDTSKTYFVQLVGPNGKADLKLLPGYPAGEKFYATEVTPASKSGYVTNGDMRVEITSTLYIRALHFYSVRPDGSFYVISEERLTPAPGANGGDLVNSDSDADYIYHYSAAGKLIERARILGTFIPYAGMIKQLTQDQNGHFYWLQSVYSSQPGDPTAVEVRRINFFPADRPMPGSEPTSTPTPITVAKSSDNTFLFSLNENNSTIRAFYGAGFGIGDDGTFWIGMGDGRVVHYSHSGQLMATLDLSGTIKYRSDLEVQGSTLWVTSGRYVDTFNLDGSPIARYVPSLLVPGGQNMIIDYKLRPGGDGQMLVEQGNGTYLKVTNQTMGTDGKPDPPPLPGYPAGGKFYAEGANPDEIMAGDVRVTIDVTATTGFTESEPLAWHILNVLKDGSFYVEVEPRTPDLGSPSPFIFVLHYAADGKLIERARVSSPDWFTVDENQIDMGPDGSFYAEGLTIVPGDGQSLFGRLDVVRVNFYPAAEPLPALPPPIPTSVVPTPIPTAQGIVPPPAIPTGTK